MSHLPLQVQFICRANLHSIVMTLLGSGEEEPCSPCEMWYIRNSSQKISIPSNTASWHLHDIRSWSSSWGLYFSLNWGLSQTSILSGISCRLRARRWWSKSLFCCLSAWPILRNSSKYTHFGMRCLSVWGNLVLIHLSIHSSTRLWLLQGKGIALYMSRAKFKSLHCFSSCFTVCTTLSTVPLLWG